MKNKIGPPSTIAKAINMLEIIEVWPKILQNLMHQVAEAQSKNDR